MTNIASDWVTDTFRIPDRANGEKKSVYLRFTCRSAATAAMLRQAMEDRAAINGIPVYSAFEDALMEASLPKDPYARRFTLLVLGEQAGVFKPLHEGVSPVQRALHDAFETLANTDNGFWILPETKALVSFASRYAEAKSLWLHAKGNPDGKTAQALDAAILALTREKALDLIPQTLLESLPEKWAEAWALPEVRFLVLILLGTPTGKEDSVKDRMEFAEVCRAVMPAWTAEDAKRKIETERRQRRIVTRSHALKSATLNYPVMWVIANPEEASGWSHAAKVSIVKAVACNHPVDLADADESTRIVLLPCPFEDVGETEEERSQRVIEMASESWTDLPRILDAEVELRYSENGNPLNWNEWKSSVRVNVSKVPETSAEMAAARGYEAWIEEGIRH